MTDPRTDPDVLKTYWEMKGVTEFEHTEKLCKLPDSDFAYRWMCSKCREDSDDIDTENCPIPDPITMSVWELAWFMRDQCEANIPHGKWVVELCQICTEGKGPIIARSTPEQWIEAATKAWGAK